MTINAIDLAAFNELYKELPPEAQTVCDELQTAITLLQTGDTYGRNVGVTYLLAKLGDWLTTERAQLEETIHA